MNAKNKINLSVTGAFNLEARVDLTTSLRVALSAHNFKASEYTFVDEAGKPVSMDRKLSSNLKIVATRTAAAEAVAATNAITTGRTSGTTTNEANTPKAGEAETSTSAAAPTDATAAEPAAAAAPVGPAQYKVIVTGAFKAEFTATAGTTLRDALKAANADAAYSSSSYVDGNGRAVSLDRKLSENLTLNASARRNGG